MLKQLCLGLAALLGAALLANGVFMLVAPETWYGAVPGVTSTGPFNQHFIRDIGLIFLLVGAAYVAGTACPICGSCSGPLRRSGCWAMPCSTCGRWLSASARPPPSRETFRWSPCRGSWASR